MMDTESEHFPDQSDIGLVNLMNNDLVQIVDEDEDDSDLDREYNPFLYERMHLVESVGQCHNHVWDNVFHILTSQEE